MSETKYLKCPCQKCGGSIEFPARGIGSAVNCPHCGEKTTLFAQPIDEAPAGEHAEGTTAAAAAETQSSPESSPTQVEGSEPRAAEDGPGSGVMRRGKLVWLSLVVLAVAGLTVAGLIYKNKSRPSRGARSSEDRTKRPPKNSPVLVTTNSPAVQPVASNAPANAPKSQEDLKVGAITLEKAKGSSLVYAVGVLRNESGHQRFGVTIELALRDARGNKAGTAKDYRAVIEPRQEWRFRALVLDSKAVSAQVERIREEE